MGLSLLFGSGYSGPSHSSSLSSWHIDRVTTHLLMAPWAQVSATVGHVWLCLTVRLEERLWETNSKMITGCFLSPKIVMIAMFLRFLWNANLPTNKPHKLPLRCRHVVSGPAAPQVPTWVKQSLETKRHNKPLWRGKALWLWVKPYQ